MNIEMKIDWEELELEIFDLIYEIVLSPYMQANLYHEFQDNGEEGIEDQLYAEIRGWA